MSTRPRLSVCGTVMNSADRLEHWLLRTLEFADEIVLLVDDASTDETLEIARTYADVVHAYEHAAYIERAMDWCLRQASGDWLLWLDDDELMHAGFREAIEPVLADTRLTHAYLQSRAVVARPGGYGWLRRFPWFPDWRLRLVRNVGSLFWHRGLLHSPIEVHGDGVTLASDEASIYHFDLVMRNRAEREAKVERYRGNGAPSCEEYYLYEDYEGGRNASLDAAAIVRDPSPAAIEEGRRRRARPTLALGAKLSHDAIRDHLAALRPAATMFSAEYLSHSFPGILTADQGHTGEVTVRNTSQVPWRTSGVQPGWVSLRYHWRHPDHGLVLREGDHSLLPGRVAPGTAVTLPAGIWAPADPGPYTLELDLRAEGLGWFSDHGVAPLEVPMEVRAAAADARSARTSAQLPPTPRTSAGGRRSGGLVRRVKTIRHPLRAELRARNVVPIAPIRVLDTRDGSGAPGAVLGPLRAGGSVTIELTEPLGIPGHAVGVIGNLCIPTATYNGYASTSAGEDDPNANGFVSVYFSDRGEPTVNQVTMRLGPPGAVGGRVTVRLSGDRQGTAQLLLDLVAYVS